MQHHTAHSGSIGLTVPSVQLLRQRQAAAQSALSGTLFAVQDHAHFLRVTCPWGNTLHVFELDAAPANEADESLPVLAQKHSGFDDGMGIVAQPGIRFLQLKVRPGMQGSDTAQIGSSLSCVRST